MHVSTMSIAAENNRKTSVSLNYCMHLNFEGFRCDALHVCMSAGHKLSPCMPGMDHFLVRAICWLKRWCYQRSCYVLINSRQTIRAWWWYVITHPGSYNCICFLLGGSLRKRLIRNGSLCQRALVRFLSTDVPTSETNGVTRGGVLLTNTYSLSYLGDQQRCGCRFAIAPSSVHNRLNIFILVLWTTFRLQCCFACVRVQPARPAPLSHKLVSNRPLHLSRDRNFDI